MFTDGAENTGGNVAVAGGLVLAGTFAGEAIAGVVGSILTPPFPLVAAFAFAFALAAVLAVAFVTALAAV